MTQMQGANLQNQLTSVTLEPERLTVGKAGTWAITCTLGGDGIGPGGTIRIRPYGNPLVRPPGQTHFPAEDNCITVETPSHVQVRLECTEWLLVTVTVLQGNLRAGDTVRVIYGDTRQGSAGMRVRAVAHDLPFRVSLQSSPEEEPVALQERPVLSLQPDEPSRIILRAPSALIAGEDAEMVLRAVDRFGNTARDYSDALHPMPVHGLELPPAVRLNDAGGAFAPFKCLLPGPIPQKRVRISVRDRAGDTVARSNPIEVAGSAGAERVFWGDIHCHSTLEQGLEPPEFVYEYARDQERLDFICHVEHNLGVKTRWTGKHYKTWRGGMPDVPAYNADTWEYRKELVRKYHQPGRFATLLGLEWATNFYGHMNVYYPGLEGPLLYPRGMWDRSETPATVWEALQGHEAIIVPHHPSAPVGTGNPPHYWATSGYDWDYYEPDHMRLVEIYSKWGSSEHFGCRRPLLNQQVEGCVQTALNRGYRLGFVAASDTHASRPGSDLYQDHTYAQSGLTAVFAPRLDRDAIYGALKARRCYATTGARAILRVWLNGHFMGDEVALENADDVKDIFVEVAADGEIETVEILKNGAPFYRYNGFLTPDLGWWRDNGQDMSVRALDKAHTTGTDYYYVRVVQRDGHMAWSSPIWVTAPAG